ncbi:hypothetical protein HPP92_025098 [Vanilla planifolia]|uniref:Uncharacterized protein n=1 Tax=Vanilla planifolia TaxID=51239 RepID=A0A835PFZ8_VANPL|nr:hypothetical protein HPP92_025098 [Vanilla planifolia]
MLSGEQSLWRIMENFLLDGFNRHLKDCSEPQHLFRALGSGEALLANPNSSDSVRRVVVDAIGHLLGRREGDILFLRYAVKLLGDVAALHGALAHSVISFLLPLLDDKNLSADALSALASVEGFLLDEHLLLSLASSPQISVRSRLVKLLVRSLDGDKRSVVVIQPHVMIRVLLGLAEDVYPLIRANAMDGLASICRKDDLGFNFQMARCFYDCASSVLRHDDELIRISAIRSVHAVYYLRKMKWTHARDNFWMQYSFRQVVMKYIDLHVFSFLTFYIKKYVQLFQKVYA